jgi:hypothetical protein
VLAQNGMSRENNLLDWWFLNYLAGVIIITIVIITTITITTISWL